MFISSKQVFRQLIYDLVGKDSYRGITYSYAWLANQFGHISLGFIPSFIISNVFKITPFESALLVSGFWFVFEIGNFLGPILIRRVSSSRYIYLPTKRNYVFEPAWNNLAYDTITDIVFFWFGALSFSLFFSYSVLNLIFLIFISFYLLYASRYWYRTKMYQFFAGYPFQYRLSQWNLNIDDSDKKNVLDFYKEAKKSKGNHLLVFGPFKHGKTSLGVALLNEFSIKHKFCTYLNVMKLFNLFHDTEVYKPSGQSLWSWKESDFLMIDDINPSKPITDELITTDLFLKWMNCDGCESENKEILSQKNVVWVIGNSKSEKQLFFQKWINMVEEIGVHPNKIISVFLDESK